MAGVSADPLEETRAWLADEDPEDRVTLPLLADPELRVIDAYGVHDRAHGIALPSIALVRAQDGTLRWLYVAATVADRPEVDDVLAQVRRLGPPGPVEVAPSDAAPVGSRGP